MNLASASVLTVCTLINHSSTGKSLGCSGITLALSTNQAPILAIPTIQILIFDQCVLFPRNTWQDWPMRNVDFLSSTNPTWASVHNYTSVQTSVHNYTSAKQMSNQGVCLCNRAEWPLLTSCPPGIRCRLRTFTGADAPDAFFNVRPETSRPRHPMQFKNSTFSINWIPHPGASRNSASVEIHHQIRIQLSVPVFSVKKWKSDILLRKTLIWSFLIVLPIVHTFCIDEYIQSYPLQFYSSSIQTLSNDNNNIRT